MQNKKKITFIIGGARSGKSGFAQRLAQHLPMPWVYLATAEPLDAEMKDRIATHRQARGDGWTTVEEPLDFTGQVLKATTGVILIDCITLWITNLMGAGRSDAEISAAVDGLATTCNGTRASVIMVSNEVGHGIVPENPLGRRFRDAAGATNQRLAVAADEVYLMAAGIPMKIK